MIWRSKEGSYVPSCSDNRREQETYRRRREESISGLRQPCDDRNCESILFRHNAVPFQSTFLIFSFRLKLSSSVGSSWAFCGDWILDDALMATRGLPGVSSCNNVGVCGIPSPSRNGRCGMCHMLRRNLGNHEMSFISFELKWLKRFDTTHCVNRVWTNISNV